MPAMFRTKIDLSTTVRDQMSELCNEYLAEATSLFTIAKTCHYNVTGMGFGPLHELFNEIAEMAISHADDLAERASQLGAYANGTCWDACKARVAPTGPMACADGKDCLETLEHLVGMYANGLRRASESSGKDLVTQNMFIDFTQAADKMLWKITAHLRS